MPVAGRIGDRQRFRPFPETRSSRPDGGPESGVSWRIAPSGWDPTSFPWAAPSSGKNHVLAFAFTRIADEDRARIVDYLESAPKREIESLLKK
ncbi:MAG: hypothetical protein M0C28_21825 [Candidatus Moduliflexus flocculans]|nr:hypothetical protein [Candidatus Moduliflexus flocculans]